LFARDCTSEQLLFADLKQLVVTLVLFVEGSLSNLALRWRVQCLAEDAAKCQKSSQGTFLAGCLGIPGVLLVKVMARWK
jgi:hypothetical protein